MSKQTFWLYSAKVAVGLSSLRSMVVPGRKKVQQHESPEIGEGTPTGFRIMEPLVLCSLRVVFKVP
jgi:hypothetical protein